MNGDTKYCNRHAGLLKVVEMLKANGFTNIEELTTTFSRTIRGYAAQLGIGPLRLHEVEYVWQRLID
jgi:hypothetical protein